MTFAGQGAFAGSGAIGRYWQARCLGFDVRRPDGRPLGIVVGVESDPESGRTTMLLVERRRRGRRTRRLQAQPASVLLVDPWRCLVVLTLPRKAPWTRHARAAWQAAVRGGGRAREQAVKAGVASWGVIALSSGAAPPIRRSAFWLGARSMYALAFVGWLYGAAVYLVTRIVCRLLLIVARVLRRTVILLVPLLVRAWEALRRVASRAAALIAAHSTREPYHSPRRRRPPVLSAALRRVRRFGRSHERSLAWAIVAAALASLSWGIADGDAAAIAIGALLILMALRILAHVRVARHSARPF
jgi:hypothetical protein